MRNDRQASFLSGISQTSMLTSAGPCQVPVLYRDGSLLGLVYRTDPRVAQGVIGDLPFEPLTVFGKAVVLLGAFEYRDTTIGPYNEIGLAIQVKRTGTSPSLLRLLRHMRDLDETAMFVVNLPVTSHIALAAGVELCGYPKYLADIKTTFSHDRVDVALGSEFVLSHHRGFGYSIKGFPFITYTVLKGRLLRTVIEVGHRVRFGGASTVKLDVRGDGPTAKSIRTLGLDTMRPAFAFRTDSMTAILPLGKDLGEIAVNRTSTGVDTAHAGTV